MPPPPPPGPKGHPKPPHEKSKMKIALFSILFATIVATIFSLILNFYEIPINTILPVVAPIWGAVLTFSYMAMSKH